MMKYGRSPLNPVSLLVPLNKPEKSGFFRASSSPGRPLFYTHLRLWFLFDRASDLLAVQKRKVYTYSRKISAFSRILFKHSGPLGEKERPKIGYLSLLVSYKRVTIKLISHQGRFSYGRDQVPSFSEAL
jgi:hypothetical protein